jgi:hypothetical protein
MVDLIGVVSREFVEAGGLDKSLHRTAAGGDRDDAVLRQQVGDVERRDEIGVEAKEIQIVDLGPVIRCKFVEPGGPDKSVNRAPASAIETMPFCGSRFVMLSGATKLASKPKKRGLLIWAAS